MSNDFMLRFTNYTLCLFKILVYLKAELKRERARQKAFSKRERDSVCWPFLKCLHSPVCDQAAALSLEHRLVLDRLLFAAFTGGLARSWIESGTVETQPSYVAGWT